MSTNLTSRQLEADEITTSSNVIHRLLLLSLFLSLLSTLLGIFVTIKSRQQTLAEDKQKAQTEKNIKIALQELHKEVDLLKSILRNKA